MSDSIWAQEAPLSLGHRQPHIRAIGATSVSLWALGIEAAIIVATSVASGILFHLATRSVVGDVHIFLATGAITAALYCSLIRISGGRAPLKPRSEFDAVGKSMVAWLFTFLFLLLISFALKISGQFSRGTIFSFFVAGGLIASIAREMVPRLLAGIASTNAYRGRCAIVIAPSSAQAQSLASALIARGYDSNQVIEFDDGSRSDPLPEGLQDLAQLVIGTARTCPPGEIYLVPGGLPPRLVHVLLNKLRILPRAIYLMPDEDVAGLLRLEVQAVGNDLVVEVQRAPLSPTETLIKRVIDLAIASVCLVIMAPVLLLIGLIIKLDSPGPMLFKQERLGHRSRPFRILKFRTMLVMEDGDSVVQASKNDSRITRVGRILRRTSIDELPQLVNVLKGEMSIIGPRPHAVAHDRLFSMLVDNYELRQHVKPGITGWAQVNGYRGETAQVELMRSRIEMDIWYATNCSLLLDAQILLRTSYELFRQRNAY